MIFFYKFDSLNMLVVRLGFFMHYTLIVGIFFLRIVPPLLFLGIGVRVFEVMFVAVLAFSGADLWCSCCFSFEDRDSYDVFLRICFFQNDWFILAVCFRSC